MSAALVIELVGVRHVRPLPYEAKTMDDYQAVGLMGRAWCARMGNDARMARHRPLGVVRAASSFNGQ
jgi:hypothetical protein